MIRLTKQPRLVWLATLAILLSFLCSPATAGDPRRQWRDEIVYVIIVQKFCNGDPANDVMLRRYGQDRAQYEGGFWGGDLAGIIQKLDYLESLGVTTLLLYPVMANDRGPFGKYLATGYRPRDYFQVDENFGDLVTLKDLVQRAHQRQLRVMLDLPLGMAGPEHPFRRNPSKKDWFGKPTPYGVSQWNADRPEVAEYLLKISRVWRDETGCDGFRLDSASLHSDAFWANYAHALRDAAHPDFWLLGEVPLHPSKIGQFLTATKFDSAYDFSTTTAREVFGKGLPLGKLSFVLREAKQYYPDPQCLCAQLDNYEKPTLASVVHEPKEARMRLALAFQMTVDRVPLIYTGDEAGADYHEVGALFKPPLSASPIHGWMKSLISLRKAQPALRRGEFTEIFSREPIYAFLRTSGERRVLVVLNNSADRQEVSFAVAGKPWRDSVLEDLHTGQAAKLFGVTGPLTIEPFGTRILAVRFPEAAK